MNDLNRGAMSSKLDWTCTKIHKIKKKRVDHANVGEKKRFLKRDKVTSFLTGKLAVIY